MNPFSEDRRNKSLMKISLERGAYKEVDSHKTSKGQFNTTGNSWLLPQVIDFMINASALHVLDPFAGKGDLLTAVAEVLPNAKLSGYDIDPALNKGWKHNDSLKEIVCPSPALILTNPPYLAKHSAKRKGVLEHVNHYYQENGDDDLYQVALRRCMSANRYVVAIVPETLINSGFPLDSFVHISIILSDIFDDTEQPVVVACIDNEWKNGPIIFEETKNLGHLNELMGHRLTPSGAHLIRFNVVGGQIGFRAVDMPNPSKPIAFMPAADLGYAESGIKVSSRLVTYVMIDAHLNAAIPLICEDANAELACIRSKTHDVILSPFKGNAKNGRRRRRLDYDLARAILEKAISRHEKNLFNNE